MRVFLTGGTGLLGSHIAERLRAEGHEVVALVRPNGAQRFLERIGAILVEGDLLEPESYRSLLRGCEAVVHAAALVTQRLDWRAYYRVNVEGTRLLCEAAAFAGLRRLLHVSTVGVYGAAGMSEERITEEWPTDGPLPEEEVYARSKRLAEEAVWGFHRSGALDVRVIRPSLNYGERDRIVTPRLARYFRMPLCFLVGPGTNTLPLVYAGNVAQGAVQALTRPEASGRVYNLTGDFPVTQESFFRRLAAALGLRPRFVRLPYGLAYGLGFFFDALPFRLRFAGRTGLSRRTVAFLARPNPFVAERARRELAWAPAVPPEEAIARTAEWYLREGRGRTHDRERTSR